MFSVALFVIDRSWTMEYFSVLKTNDLSSQGKIWKILKCVLLRERNQFEMATSDSSYITLGKRQNYAESEKISGCQGFSRWGWW